MRTPLTHRQCAYKEFYVFFAFGGKYSGCYAVIQAQSYEKACYKAIQEYGSGNVRGVYANIELAEAKIKAFNLKII